MDNLLPSVLLLPVRRNRLSWTGALGRIDAVSLESLESLVDSQHRETEPPLETLHALYRIAASLLKPQCLTSI